MDHFTKNCLAVSGVFRCAILNTAFYKHFTRVSAHMGARIPALRMRFSCHLLDTHRKSKNKIRFCIPWIPLLKSGSIMVQV